MTRKVVMRVAKGAFGLILLGIVVLQLDPDELAPLIKRGDPWWLACSVASFAAALCVFQALRLHVLIAHYTASLRTSIRLFFIGAFFNNLLPSNVGGDAMRLYYLSKQRGVGWAGPMSLLLLHRVSGLFAMLLGFAVYLALEGSRFFALATNAGVRINAPTPWMVLVSLTLLFVFVLLVYATRRTKLGHKVYERISATLSQARAAIGELSTASMLHLAWLTIFFHGARMLGFYFAVGYLGQSIALWDLIPVLTLTAIMALLPITVGGLGLVEGSVGVGLQMFGVSASASIAAALINRAVMVFTALIGGMLYATEQGAQTDSAS